MLFEWAIAHRWRLKQDVNYSWQNAGRSDDHSNGKSGEVMQPQNIKKACSDRR
jgi:hypothetical protein